MEVLTVLAELAALAGGVSNAVKIVEAAKAAGRSHLLPDEVEAVRAHLNAPQTPTLNDYFNGANYQN